ncbi:tail fiber protein [Escherichia coli]|uniref:tail fiber protein n=2 Tax=Escherichia coli TaxID=562 RepID=UPI00199C5510|nr:tail fiber protein [Escherichia coli]CAD6089852.1 putative phage tail fiber protein [Escherichia coli]
MKNKKIAEQSPSEGDLMVLTDQGKQKIEQAYRQQTVVKLTHIALGDGNGAPVTPTHAATALVNQVGVLPISRYARSGEGFTGGGVTVTQTAEFAGKTLREAGLIDADGVLIGYGSLPDTVIPAPGGYVAKEVDIDLCLLLSHAESVSVVIDSGASVTRDEFEARLKKHEQSRNHPDATLKDKGFVQLSNATDSDSETEAATPKAVKAANDNANKRVPDTREVNGHALSGDVTLSADDVGAMPLHGQIPAGTDLNTLDGTRKGYYYQGGNAGATLALHYPVAQAGYLRVVPNGANGAAGCAQEYVPYTSSVVYRRNHAANTSTWGEWIADYNVQNPPPNTGYTKAESDARYVQGIRLGAAINIGRGGDAPAGHLVSGVDGGESVDWVNARPVQALINGAWVLVTSL